MTSTISSPIPEIRSISGDDRTNSPQPPAAGAAALNQELGRWTVSQLADYQGELAMAVLSLTEAGAQPWPISHHEPVVALLRLSARLAVLAPEVATPAAAQLLELLRRNR